MLLDLRSLFESQAAAAGTPRIFPTVVRLPRRPALLAGFGLFIGHGPVQTTAAVAARTPVAPVVVKAPTQRPKVSWPIIGVNGGVADAGGVRPLVVTLRRPTALVRPIVGISGGVEKAGGVRPVVVGTKRTPAAARPIIGSAWAAVEADVLKIAQAPLVVSVRSPRGILWPLVGSGVAAVEPDVLRIAQLPLVVRAINLRTAVRPVVGVSSEPADADVLRIAQLPLVVTPAKGLVRPLAPIIGQSPFRPYGGHFVKRYRIPSGYHGRPAWLWSDLYTKKAVEPPKPKTVRRPKPTVVAEPPKPAPTVFDGFQNTDASSAIKRYPLARELAAFDALDGLEHALDFWQEVANDRQAALDAARAQAAADALWQQWLAEAEAARQRMMMVLLAVHFSVDDP